MNRMCISVETVETHFHLHMCMFMYNDDTYLCVLHTCVGVECAIVICHECTGSNLYVSDWQSSPIHVSLCVNSRFLIQGIYFRLD